MTPATGDRVAHLYGLPLSEFTPERNALAAELRREGDGAAAETVKRLRKPTAPAWAVNQLVKAEPDLVEALLGAGGELRQAHRQAASGRKTDQLRAAAAAERAAIDQLIGRAAAVLGRAPSAALAESMRNTLHAASSDDEARERVAAGTVETEMRPVGLGPLPRGAPPAPERGADRKGATRRRATDARELKAAAAAETALRRELDAASRALERAEAEYARAREAADVAADRAKGARRRLREARAGLAEAERQRSRLERG
jgi:hypothetical protein